MPLNIYGMFFCSLVLFIVVALCVRDASQGLSTVAHHIVAPWLHLMHKCSGAAQLDEQPKAPADYTHSQSTTHTHTHTHTSNATVQY